MLVYQRLLVHLLFGYSNPPGKMGAVHLRKNPAAQVGHELKTSSGWSTVIASLHSDAQVPGRRVRRVGGLVQRI